MDQHSGLYEQLLEYGNGDHLPMHMPGHKRNRKLCAMENPYGWDITEIDGFDDLHEPEGILKEGMEAAAQLYGSDHCWYLINGSTAGILSGIASAVKTGDMILMARNCHKSVYHAVLLNQLEPVYLHPAADPGSGILTGIEPLEVEAALKQWTDPRTGESRIRLVVITSPTYEGILSDVQTIACICHAHGVPLIVDEAHGAHLSSGHLYGSCFPEGAISCGADLVVQSLHKTLPAFTQTGLIHQQGSLIDPDRVKHFLDIYQTSSPSYILMAGIDRCIRMMREDSRRIMGDWAEGLRLWYRRTAELRCLRVITLDSCERFFAWDPSKLVISTRGSGHTGRELMDVLREKYRIELEMASADYVIAMTGAGDTVETLTRFADAICEIDMGWSRTAPEDRLQIPAPDWQAFREETELLPCSADRLRGRRIPLDRSAEGEIALEYVYAYPPGIPVLVPGEKITDQALRVIEAYEKAGIPMRGYSDTESHRIRATSIDC